MAIRNLVNEMSKFLDIMPADELRRYTYHMFFPLWGIESSIAKLNIKMSDCLSQLCDIASARPRTSVLRKKIKARIKQLDYELRCSIATRQFTYMQNKILDEATSNEELIAAFKLFSK